MSTSCGSTIRKIVRPRTFCRTVRRVAVAGKVKDIKSGAEGKPSLKRAKELVVLVSKLGDVARCRLKPL